MSGAATEGCEDPDWDMLACGGSRKRGGQGASPAALRRRTSDVSFLSVSAVSDEDEDEEDSAQVEGVRCSPSSEDSGLRFVEVFMTKWSLQSACVTHDSISLPFKIWK